MKDFLNRFKNFGLLELLVIFSAVYVVAMLLWTASTRSAVEEKANIVKYNHKQIVDLLMLKLMNATKEMKIQKQNGEILAQENGYQKKLFKTLSF